MSDFYSRCLVCGLDLPPASTFCSEAHKIRWQATHTDDAKPVVMTDEWPLVQRERVAPHDPRTCTHHRCKLPF